MPASPSAANRPRSSPRDRSSASPARATPTRRATPGTARRRPPEPPLQTIESIRMSLSPRVIALLGFGEAGSAIARGLAAEGGWRGPSVPGDNAPRRVIAIDPALDKDTRGTALGKEARRLDVAISDRYTEALGDADLVICAVQGEHALEAAQSAAPLLKKGAHYLDLCTVTGKMSDEDRSAIEVAGGRYIDIAVMGGFFKSGIKAPMLV